MRRRAFVVVLSGALNSARVLRAQQKAMPERERAVATAFAKNLVYYGKVSEALLINASIEVAFNYRENLITRERLQQEKADARAQQIAQFIGDRPPGRLDHGSGPPAVSISAASTMFARCWRSRTGQLTRPARNS
jgi:hypothetical protein